MCIHIDILFSFICCFPILLITPLVWLCKCVDSENQNCSMPSATNMSSDINRAAAKKKKQTASYPLGDGELFGRLVRVVDGEGKWRECETCHKNSPVRKMLLNNPDLGGWQRENFILFRFPHSFIFLLLPSPSLCLLLLHHSIHVHAY